MANMLPHPICSKRERGTHPSAFSAAGERGMCSASQDRKAVSSLMNHKTVC